MILVNKVDDLVTRLYPVIWEYNSIGKWVDIYIQSVTIPSNMGI